jgi:RND family efflux transporter MFP subunit
MLAPILTVAVRAGNHVEAGQVLATLDAREADAQAARASAAFAAAQQSVHAAGAAKAAADAGVALATASFARVSGLYDKGVAAGRELDEATAALDTARAAVAGADAHAAEAAAAVDAAAHESKAAAVSASYARIVAPFAGTVVERLVDPGTMAAPGLVLFTVEDTSMFRLEVTADEARARSISVGQPASVRLDGSSGEWRDARVSEIARLDAARHSFVVRIDLGRSRDLRSGLFGRARFVTGSREALSVPASSVVRRGQMTFVFAVDRDAQARLRAVTVGEPFSGRVEVLAGARDGEQVVDRPPPALRDGTTVTSGAGP